MEVSPISTTPWFREIPCEDAFGRIRKTVVLIDSDGCIAVKFPPGEGLKFRSAEDAHLMQAALREAIVEQRRLAGEGS